MAVRASDARMQDNAVRMLDHAVTATKRAMAAAAAKTENRTDLKMLQNYKADIGAHRYPFFCELFSKNSEEDLKKIANTCIMILNNFR